jgi:hypothetical protein
MPDLVDVDLDALAQPPKRVKLAGKVWKLPGDMPLELFFKVQSFEHRVDAGEAETAVLQEIHDELLALFQVHQPGLKALPAMGVLDLAQALPRIYAGGAVPGEAQAETPTPRSRKRTPSRPAAPSRAARPTSR